MRQFFEAFLVFQIATSRYSPVHSWIKQKIDLENSLRYKKWAVLSIVMLLTWIAQCYLF